jgi:hypothetical protein
MLKRVSWFVSGAIAGIAGAGFAKRKVKQTAAQLAPTHIAKTAAAKVREKGHDVAEAVREGREAKRAKETELRAKLDGDDLRPDAIDGIDVVANDLHVAGAGRVIVIDEPLDDRADRDEAADREDWGGPRRHGRRRNHRRT